MFRGSQIPEILDIAGLLDRTLWVMRFRFFEYFKISLVTYAPVMLLIILLWSLGILQMDFLGESFWRKEVFFVILFLSVPTVISDLACQYYTSFLVRDNEKPWFHAVKMTFSKELWKYSLTRLIGAVWLMLIGALGIVAAAIPIVGILVYWALIVGTYTYFFGLSNPVLVEEKVSLKDVFGRNFRLGKTQFFGGILAAVAGSLVSFVVMLCVLIFFLLLSGLVIVLMEGQQNMVLMESFTERFIYTLMILLVPLLFGFFFTPLKSIFYSVLYYNLRARKEGFHLENRINMYQRELDEAEAARLAQANQEAENMSATA